MHVHFIAIGGSAMHNLALALHKKGYIVTGSDDEIFEPSRSRLQACGLLPETRGWDPGRITSDLDAVILGMHAKADNPELLKAAGMGLRIFSYPEFLYEQSKNKQRVVIGGSHGKTTITAMILHVLRLAGLDCDYMVGAQLEGFEVMVRLTEEAPVMVIEGDEYLTSPTDPRPKFHLYKPDIALLSGVAWDHINVFPTFEQYVGQFEMFIRLISPGGTLIYCSEDEVLARICPGSRNDITFLPYQALPYEVHEGKTCALFGEERHPLQIFGRHNLMNLQGARLVCNRLGVTDPVFFEAIRSFKGASKRLEKVTETGGRVIFRDFAHAPSKVAATVQAVREQYPGRRLVACLELHTYSSLSREFLGHYRGTLDPPDVSIVYYNPHALMIKRLPEIGEDQVRDGFGKEGLEVFSDSKKLLSRLMQESMPGTVLLMMSSGDYDGVDIRDFGQRWAGLK